MNIKITPATLSGSVRAIPSKSEAHRLLLCALLSGEATEIEMERSSDDIEATISCLTALGATVVREGAWVTVTPGKRKAQSVPLLDCSDCGSTLRFMLPVAAVLTERARFTGKGRLPNRPIAHLKSAMEEHGVSFSSDTLPFEIHGRLRPGRYALPGHISSQYLTGLLLALSVVKGRSVIELSSRLESSAYAELTVSVLQRFGAEVKEENGAYSITGRPELKSPGAVHVEGDWSNACFFLAAGALGGKVSVTGLDMNSAQGDKAAIGLLRRFGANVQVDGDRVTVSPGELLGCEVDVSEVPDLMPALAAVAAVAKGESRFINGARLRLKESDRIAAVGAMIRSLGGRAKERPDGLTVNGGGLWGGTVDSFSDHRIAMAASVAAIRCSDAVMVVGAESVNKSYPGFFGDYNRIGGKAYGF